MLPAHQLTPSFLLVLALDQVLTLRLRLIRSVCPLPCDLDHTLNEEPLKFAQESIRRFSSAFLKKSTINGSLS